MVTNLFGIFLCNSIKDVSCAIIKSLQGRPLYIPKSDELKAILETKEKNGPGFPMCAGAIGRVQIAIIINTRGQIENRPLQNTRSAGRK